MALRAIHAAELAGTSACMAASLPKGARLVLHHRSPNMAIITGAKYLAAGRARVARPRATPPATIQAPLEPPSREAEETASAQIAIRKTNGGSLSATALKGCNVGERASRQAAAAPACHRRVLGDQETTIPTSPPLRPARGVQDRLS